jgi:hypothetical protein
VDSLPYIEIKFSFSGIKKPSLPIAMDFFRIHVTFLIFKIPYFFISISTPILAFPQGGRNKTFPPWGKMKGGKNQLESKYK